MGTRQIKIKMANGTNKYTNDKSLALVQTKRMGNYAEDLIKVLEEYSEEIGSTILGYNKTSSEKTMGIRYLRNYSRRMQNRKSHQDMVEGIAVESGKKLDLSTGIIRAMARNHDEGHTFLGHGGEWYLSQIKEEYGLGVYTHSALRTKRINI